MMWSTTELRAALGGDIVAGQVNCSGPGHSSKDRSLSVRPSDGRNSDGFVVFSHVSDDMGTCRDYVRRRLGLPDWQPEDRSDRAEDIIARMASIARRAEAAKIEQAETEKRVRSAVRIWNEAVNPIGTIADAYLTSRSLQISSAVAETALRFHPRCPWGQERVAAMVAAMRDVVSGEIRAVHRTALTPTGEKIDRMMLAPSGGTAIMLTGPSDTLVIGEGIESCLSAVQLGYGPMVWALGSSGAIGRLPVLDHVQHLVLLEERDRASANAVSDCGNRWAKAGKAVSVVLPTVGKDLNDSIRGIA